jgi:hypothetical protein
MHDHIVSLGREVSTLKTNLIPSLVIQVPVPNQDSVHQKKLDGNEQHTQYYLCNGKLCYNKDKYNLKYMLNNKNSE